MRMTPWVLSAARTSRRAATPLHPETREDACPSPNCALRSTRSGRASRSARRWSSPSKRSGMPETSMISPAGPSFAACDQLRWAHRRTCSSADPSRTGSAWRMESIGRKRPSRQSSSCQRAQEFILCSRQGFAGALPSLLLREAVTGPAGLGGMAAPALLDQHQTAGLARLGCGPRVLRKGSKRIYSSR